MTLEPGHLTCHIAPHLRMSSCVLQKRTQDFAQSVAPVSRYRKLEIQLRVKTDSLYLTTPKHSGGADIIGSAGAVNPAVQSLQLGQRIQSSPRPTGIY